MATTFLFDIGNVIVRFDFQKAFRAMVEGGATMEAIESAAMSTLREKHETGLVSDQTFVAEAMSISGFQGDAENFIRLWQEIFELNEPMAEVIETLASRKTPLFLLSNTSELHLGYLQSAFPVFNFFQGGVYSQRARSMKPDAKIYHQAIEELKLDPGSTAYIDDLPANVAAGIEHGFMSVCYDPDDHQTLCQGLEGYGVSL